MLIMLSAYLFGVYLSKGVKDKVRVYEQVYSAAVYCTELVKRRTPTDIIMQRVGAVYPDAVSTGEMSEFCEALGTVSLNEQLGELEYRCEKLKDRLEKAREKSEKESGLCKLLPLFFAALAVIMLL